MPFSEDGIDSVRIALAGGDKAQESLDGSR